MTDSIYKFILFAREHPEKKLHVRFTATAALGANRDFDWAYEGQKATVVQKLCTVEATPQLIKNTWLHYKKQLCYYHAFYVLAKSLLKQGKNKDYKFHWTDLLE